MYRDDYARGGFPMLPARVSPRQAAGWVLVHTVPTALAALLLAGHPALGWLYFVPVGLATVDLIARNVIPNGDRKTTMDRPKPMISMTAQK